MARQEEEQEVLDDNITVPGDDREPGRVAEGRPHPISYWRQQASLKSVTGDSSAWMGWALNHRLFRSMTAFSASSSRRNYTQSHTQVFRACDAANPSQSSIGSH